jgi:hypothetical protein
MLTTSGPGPEHVAVLKEFTTFKNAYETLQTIADEYAQAIHIIRVDAEERHATAALAVHAQFNDFFEKNIATLLHQTPEAFDQLRVLFRQARTMAMA